MEQQITIRPACRHDAPAIARVVMDAIHEEGCMHLAGGKERLPLLSDVFIRLSASENSQYSYLNTLVAEDEHGNTAGAIVSYDGARLHELRKAFISTANTILGYNLREEDMNDETDADEIYLDSLAVFPAYRGKGLAKRLLKAAMDTHRSTGKPFGLLCDPANPDAYRLYTRLGFTDIGTRPFAGIIMRHMRLSTK